MTEDNDNGQFSPQKIYIKDISFETPNSPGIFAEDWRPNVKMDLSSSARQIGDNLYEVVLIITVTVTNEKQTAYLVEAHQAGIFHIEGFSTDDIEHMVASVCPNILFPFAREYISDLVMRGGFPQLLLAPVNFEALYQRRQSDTAAETEIRH